MNRLNLLSMIAWLHPEIYDWVHPHGPVIGVRRAEVALQPQPLPPRGSSAATAAVMTQRMISLAVDAEMQGQSASFAMEIIDEWCGTPWPRRWPKPRDGFGPQPVPWAVLSGRITGALTLAAVGSRLDSDLAATFTAGAQQLADAALEEYNSSLAG